MPFESAVNIMDAFFYDGARVIFMLSLSILQHLQSQLLKVTDDGQAMTILSNFLEKIDNTDEKKSVRTFDMICRALYTFEPSLNS